ncbi:MAG: ABC-2 family transporter protein [Lachnospiraceae bacterium]|nr:ABC-2 family transporter protein [Lachnospiraceae bacterium]
MNIVKNTSARVKQYLALIRGSIMEGLTFRTGTIVSIIGNLIYLVIIYFLWKAIYNSSPTDVVNGMTFYDTLVYLVLAAAMFNFLDSFVVWDIGRSYQTGELVEFLVKPIDYQIYLFFSHFGNNIVAFVITFLPTFFIIYFVTQGSFALGINIIFFLISILLAVGVNFCVDFLVGIICFYTQSIWGVNIMKEVVVSLLSGATIPLAFFPEKFRMIVDLLPFQAIYNMPLQILIDKNMAGMDYIKSIGLQLFWLIVLYYAGKLFWKRSMRILTVNGG